MSWSGHLVVVDGIVGHILSICCFPFHSSERAFHSMDFLGFKTDLIILIDLLYPLRKIVV